MKWIYIFKTDWTESVEKPVQTIHIRPTMNNESGELMVGKIVQVTIIGMEFYFNLKSNPLDTEEAKQIYHEKLKIKDYHILKREVSTDEDYLLSNFEIYLKQRDFNKKEFLEWVEKIFIMEGYQNSKLEKGTTNDFLELNPIMRLFSMENAKKFEDKFGKEWWKK